MTLLLTVLISCITIVIKKNLNHGGSYVGSPDWIKNKKATTNPFNDDDKCFQYATIFAINHKEIGKNSQRTSKIGSFISKLQRNNLSIRKRWPEKVREKSFNNCP